MQDKCRKRKARRISCSFLQHNYWPKGSDDPSWRCMYHIQSNDERVQVSNSYHTFGSI